MLTLPDIIEKATPEDIAHLRELLAKMDELNAKNDVEALSPVAREFHTAITAISGKNRILRVIEGQDEYIRRFSAMAIKQEDRRNEANEEHHRLVDLIEQKDLPAFEALMKQHIERSKECCLAALAARKQNRELDT
jgi:DNA-binding GntR family transcriptional regulator